MEPRLETEKTASPLDSIQIGTAISYKMKLYEVKEVPSEQNNQKYVLVHKSGKTIYKLTAEQMRQQLAGEAKIIPAPNPEPEKIPDAPAPEQETERERERERTLAALRATIAGNKKTIADAMRELEEIERRIAEANKKEASEKTPEIKEFSTDLIESIILKMLESFEKVTEVESVKVKGVGNKMSFSIRIRAEEKIIGLNTVVEYGNDKFTAESPEIDAGMLTKIYLKSKIKPWLDKIEKILKDEVEKQEGKKPEKVWFEDGKLKAVFK